MKLKAVACLSLLLLKPAIAVLPFTHASESISESAIMALIGFALLGIAGLGRKKYRKKP